VHLIDRDDATLVSNDHGWVRTLDAALAFQAGHPELGEPPGFWI
jgi:hypothetical protein